jgi:hypothetical protein
MKRSFYVTGLVCAAVLSLCPAGAVAGREAGPSFVLPVDESFVPPSGAWTARVVGIPGPLSLEKKALPGLPTFTRTVVARGRRYRYTMVGSDPYAARPVPVTIPVQIIPVRVEFNDGTVLDPTESGPGCAGPGDPLTNTLESPLFTNFDYGEGGRQYVEENRRSEFWAVVHAKPNSTVRVAPIVLPTITLTVNVPSIAKPCGRAAVIPFPSLDQLIRTTLIPQLRGQGVSPKTFPVLLFSNVLFRHPTEGIFAGYHSVFSLGGSQTYGVALYDTIHSSDLSSDISVLSHELAEWYDDPFVNNATPPWGNIGQVDGCQATLEVADPLTDTLFEIPMPNGLKYHPQELAFFSWFFNQSPSLGLDGAYSWGGTLTSPAAPCK